jgi:hypothetical protein
MTRSDTEDAIFAAVAVAAYLVSAKESENKILLTKKKCCNMYLTKGW